MRYLTPTCCLGVNQWHYAKLIFPMSSSLFNEVEVKINEAGGHKMCQEMTVLGWFLIQRKKLLLIKLNNQQVIYFYFVQCSCKNNCYASVKDSSTRISRSIITKLFMVVLDIVYFEMCWTSNWNVTLDWISWKYPFIIAVNWPLCRLVSFSKALKQTDNFNMDGRQFFSAGTFGRSMNGVLQLSTTNS